MNVTGTAVREIEEECGIVIHPSELVDLTSLASQYHPQWSQVGIPPSPGGCDEVMRYFYLEKKVTDREIADMQHRLTGLREHYTAGGAHGRYVEGVGRRQSHNVRQRLFWGIHLVSYVLSANSNCLLVCLFTHTRTRADACSSWTNYAKTGCYHLLVHLLARCAISR
jgi:hypothetical protein